MMDNSVQVKVISELKGASVPEYTYFQARPHVLKAIAVLRRDLIMEQDNKDRLKKEASNA